ncbi:MAG: DUF4373 domain-containing protein [Bacteroidaceae bacterium]|nr:DUF4373 domain-containing protein [Bacteroidaceae bacterium]
MARPQKTPLTYFPFATAFPGDDKIIIIAGEYGAKGEAVVVRLWCALYGTYGYYLPYDDVNTPPTIARVDDRRYGVSAALVVAIVNRCLQVGLFHEALYKKYGILTSEAIQDRYFRAVNRRRGVTAIRQYLLVTPPAGTVIVDINPINVCNNSLNKIKDNNILTDVRISLSSTEREKNNFLNKPLKERKKKESCDEFSVAEHFFFRNFKAPIFEAERFRNHYNARGWCDRSGAEIHDILSLARCWEQRGKGITPPHHPEALNCFRSFYTLWREELPADKREELLSLIPAITAQGSCILIHCPKIVASYLEEQLSKYTSIARQLFNPFNNIQYILTDGK